METSLRLGGDSKAFKIQAKERLPITTRVHLEAHGEIVTWTGAPNYLARIIRNFYPELSASMVIGVQLNKHDDLSYSVRGKKAFPISHDGLVGINVKGRYDVDKDLKKGFAVRQSLLGLVFKLWFLKPFDAQMKQSGAAEFAWSIFNFQKDQDV